VEASFVEVNGESVSVIFDGSTAIVNGEVVTFSEEGSTVVIDGEEVTVIFDGSDVIVNGDVVSELVPSVAVAGGLVASEAVVIRKSRSEW